MSAAPSRVDHAAEIKRRLTDARKLCSALGLLEGYKPATQAGGLLVRCPQHGDRTPSCSVTPGPDGTIRVRCFGCELAGDVYSLIGAVRGLDPKIRDDFKTILREGADLASYDMGGDPRSATPPRAPVQPPAVPAPAPPRLDAATFSAVAASLVSLCPFDGSIGVGMVCRGILDEARRDGWGELPRNVVMSGDEARRARAAGFGTEDFAADRLISALRGLFDDEALSWVLRGSGLAYPEHRLLIPWRRPDGAIWNLQRRYAPLYGDEQPGEQVPKYIWPASSLHRAPEVFPYGADAPSLATAAEVWIVEGAPDVLALRALNRSGALAADGKPRNMAVLGIPGVQAWAAYRKPTLAHVRGRVVRVALDADRAGRAAVAAMGADAWKAGAKDVRDKAPPRGAKDWAEVSAKILWIERKAA